jgi:hypothetical protein
VVADDCPIVDDCETPDYAFRIDDSPRADKCSLAKGCSVANNSLGMKDRWQPKTLVAQIVAGRHAGRAVAKGNGDMTNALSIKARQQFASSENPSAAEALAMSPNIHIVEKTDNLVFRPSAKSVSDNERVA